MRHRFRVALVALAVSGLIGASGAAIASAAVGNSKAAGKTKVARAHAMTKGTKANCPNM